MIYLPDKLSPRMWLGVDCSNPISRVRSLALNLSESMHSFGIVAKIFYL